MIPVREHFRNAPASKAPAKPDMEKRELGQFFTPPSLADFIASFFTRPLQEWRVIDAGASGGAMTFALVQQILKQDPLPASVKLTTYEVDPAAIEQLRDTLQNCSQLCTEQCIIFTGSLHSCLSGQIQWFTFGGYGFPSQAGRPSAGRGAAKSRTR